MYVNIDIVARFMARLPKRNIIGFNLNQLLVADSTQPIIELTLIVKRLLDPDLESSVKNNEQPKSKDICLLNG